MLQTEFVRSMQCNYERILLDKQPEEKKYQYCILSRGGIKGLLPCSLRYLNGLAYLYYDISSKQSITQLYGKRCITRAWLKDFMWSFEQIKTELGRFLLDERNILWYPEQIFQDLENNIFSFLYIPYYEGESSFLKFLEYLVEHIDYEDEVLVECVYKMYEQCERNGEVYLQTQIFQDAKILNREKESESVNSLNGDEMTRMSDASSIRITQDKAYIEDAETADELQRKDKRTDKSAKKGIRYLFEGKKRRNREEREHYRQSMQLAMEGYAVAEDSFYETTEEASKRARGIPYGTMEDASGSTPEGTPCGMTEEDDEEYGRTVYIEESRIPREIIRRLYTSDGRILMQLNEETCTIGKKKGEVDLVLEDFTVSRMHARISKENEGMYLEDLNSTNGTYKNGLRMQPYEKRKLEEGDEIKIGKVVLIYR